MVVRPGQLGLFYWLRTLLEGGIKLKYNPTAQGLIFDIQRFAVHDGPGIRTLVFFKGCSLRCMWCANPEGQSFFREIGYIAANCLNCGRCFEVCPVGAIETGPNRVNRDLCMVCGACASVCPSMALTVVGTKTTVAEVLTEVKRDVMFYRRSQGGVTLSGGEPLGQPEFALELLKGLKAEYLHTAIETAGMVKEEVLDRALPYLDLVLYDIKHMDNQKHEEYVGAPNTTILSNARFIVTRGVPLIVRIPVIPGCNDSSDNIRQTAQFAKEIGAIELHLLPYHRLGKTKYDKIGRQYLLADVTPPARDKMLMLKDIVESVGVQCVIGGH